MKFKAEIDFKGPLTLRHRGRIDVYHHQEPSKPAGQQGTVITTDFGDFAVTARAASMSYKLPQGKRIVVQITYLDEAGNPAVVETVNWSSSNEQAAPVLPDTNDFTRAAIDGLEIAQGIQINASADADLGSGTRELITPFMVDVVGGEAVSGSIAVVGEPIDIPGNGGTTPPPPGFTTPRPDHTLPTDPHVEPHSAKRK